MPKTSIKTKSICISIPIGLNEFLGRIVKQANQEGQPLTKSALITLMLEEHISVSKEVLDKPDSKA